MSYWKTTQPMRASWAGIAGMKDLASSTVRSAEPAGGRARGGGQDAGQRIGGGCGGGDEEESSEGEAAHGSVPGSGLTPGYGRTLFGSNVSPRARRASEGHPSLARRAHKTNGS